MVVSRRIVSHSAPTTNTTTQKSLADGDGRSVETFASLAIIGEPDANRSSDGGRGEP
jgi:hypothetical protein